MNWRPIETAPKDGTVILTDEGTAIWIDPEDWSCPMTKGWQLCTGGGTLVDEDGEGLMLSPLWWMPIPPIPTPGVFYVIHGRDAVRLAERDALSIYHKGKQTTLGDALQLVKGEPALLNVIPCGIDRLAAAPAGTTTVNSGLVVPTVTLAAAVL